MNKPYEWSLKFIALLHCVFVTVPSSILSNLENLNITTKNIKRITSWTDCWDLYFQFVQSQLNNSPCSYSISGNIVPWEQLHVGADATCLISLPLQFESPGSLFLLTSHCRGLDLHTSASDGSTTRNCSWKWAYMALIRRDSAPRDCLPRHPNVSEAWEVYVALLQVRNCQTDLDMWPSRASNLNYSSRLGESVKLDLKTQ